MSLLVNVVRKAEKSGGEVGRRYIAVYYPVMTDLGEGHVEEPLFKFKMFEEWNKPKSNVKVFPSKL